MEIVLAAFFTLCAMFGATGIIIYYFETRLPSYWYQHMLLTKRLEAASHLLGMIGRVEAILEYPNGDKTLRQWKDQLINQLQDMRAEIYRLGFFLPDETRQMLNEYIANVMECLQKLDIITTETDALAVAIEVMTEVKQIERSSSQLLQSNLQKLLE
ncbi:MAG: hypothetical protein CUN55_10750 [Phototrophicales bacterium]|nr:MAG: hypothetical protein CUN55_10750 [Phototrophicales bacterium]